jgi:hypothetical protein
MCESAAIGDEETSSARDLLDACDHLVDNLLVDDAVHRLGPDVLVVEDRELVVLGELRGCSEFNGLPTVKPLWTRTVGKELSDAVSNQNRARIMAKPATKSSLDHVLRERASTAATNDNDEGDALVEELLEDAWLTPVSKSTVVRKAKKPRANYPRPTLLRPTWVERPTDNDYPLSRSEACDMLGVSRRKLRKLLAAGDLVTTREG